LEIQQLSSRYDFILSWEEDDLLSLPNQETADYEYKSSKTKDDELATKIIKAASAFWNSGGGIFIVGVDNNGKIDGGISNEVSRQSRKDWIDRHLSKVSPQAKYLIKPISAKSGSESILSGRVVVVIAFEESFSGPHMATDNKYYIRAGAHSDPASHYLS
jgi:predicted HTH transcriptional regulator